jgi:hypothetical protein
MGKHRYLTLLSAASITLCGVAAPARAMDQATYDSAQAMLASALYDIEGNLIEKEAIDMNIKDLEPKGRSIAERAADYKQRAVQHNAYCQGTFEEPEYSRRLAQCNAEEAQYNDLTRQLDTENQAFQAQVTELQARDTRRGQAAQPMLKRLETGVIQLVTACMSMTLPEQDQLCHLPSAPGPRTSSMVTEMNATLRGELTKAAH